MNTFLNNFVVGVSAAIIVVLCFLAAALVSPLIGAFVGATFVWVFPQTASAFMSFIGATNMEFWQLTAVIAVIGMFFKSKPMLKTEKE